MKAREIEKLLEWMLEPVSDSGLGVHYPGPGEDLIYPDHALLGLSHWDRPTKEEVRAAAIERIAELLEEK